MSLDIIPIYRKPSSTSHIGSRLRTRLQYLRSGISSQLPHGQLLAFAGGKRLSREALLSAIEGALAEFAAVDLLITQLSQQRLKVRKLLPQVLAALQSIELSLRTHLGRGNLALAQFGLKPRLPRRKLDSKAQLVANVRKLETRKIRHTLGKKQKSKLKAAGAVTVEAKKR